MWHIRKQMQANGRILTMAIDDAQGPVTYKTVLDLWQQDHAFRAFFLAQLAACPFTAYRWETPPLTRKTVRRSFEFALLNSPSLDRLPDPLTFAPYFTDQPVVNFLNRGHDALLVVPCPQGNASAYSHLGAFVRHAPIEQQHALWQSVGAALHHRLSNHPIWLSTAGAGVAWLHVRLDNQPKYYGYRPYRSLVINNDKPNP